MLGTISQLELNGRFDTYQAQIIKTWIKDEIQKMASDGQKANILVDLSQVTFIDSAGLSTLVMGIKQARLHNGALHLCGLTKPVRIIFELSWLDKAFPIFDSKDEALKAFEL